MLQQPRERDLPGQSIVRLRDATDDAPGSGQLAGPERKPRHEADLVRGAVGKVMGV